MLLKVQFFEKFTKGKSATNARISFYLEKKKYAGKAANFLEISMEKNIPQNSQIFPETH